MSYVFNPFTGNFDDIGNGGITFPDLASPPNGTALGSEALPFGNLYTNGSIVNFDVDTSVGDCTASVVIGPSNAFTDLLRSENCGPLIVGGGPTTVGTATWYGIGDDANFSGFFQTFVRARGTPVAPSQILAGDTITLWEFEGRTGTGFNSDSGRITVSAVTDFTTSPAGRMLKAETFDYYSWSAKVGTTFSMLLDATGLVLDTPITATDFIVSGSAFKTDTANGHQAFFQAYDVDGTAYKTFITLTNANTPTCAITAPSGGTLSGDFTTLKIGGVNVGTGSGTVTSIAASVPAFLSIAGSPVTTSGTLAITYSGTALPVANGGTAATSASITAFNNITGYSATGATGTTSTNLVFSTSPTLITPTLGAATATTINGNAFTAGTYTLTGAASKTLTFSNSLTLAGTDATTMTFPATSATIARTDAAQTFTGSQTIAALVGPVTITEAVGSSALTITGATQTTSFPAFAITQTWNGSGQVFTALDVNVTNTLSSGSSLLQNWRVGGTSVSSVRSDGTMFATGIRVASATQQFDSTGLSLGTSAVVQFSDVIIRRGGAAATVQLGSDVNGAAVNQTFQAANGITGTDKTGGNLTVASGKGTGAGAVSSLIFQTPTVLGSGTTAQSLATRLTLSSAGATFAAGITTIGGATFHTTSSALTDGAGVALGTLATAPSAGNPTKWIGINDNGTTRYIPAW